VERLLSLSTLFHLVAEGARAADHCAALRLGNAEDDCKSRRKALESLKMESKTARRTERKWRKLRISRSQRALKPLKTNNPAK